MTPDVIDSDVKKLLKLLGSNTAPVYLDVNPESYSQVVECFPAVKEKISRDGDLKNLAGKFGKQILSLKQNFTPSGNHLMVI